MKNLKYPLLFLLLFALVSCEDVIELELPEGEKRVVVDAWLNPLSEVQTIKLKYTAPYFESTPAPLLTEASVTVYDDKGNSYLMTEEEPGIYRHAFFPQIGHSYRLEFITKEGVEYTSSPETMAKVPALEELYFDFLPKSSFEEEGYYVYIGLIDPKGVKNYYRYQYFINDVLQNKPENLVIQDDDLIDGAELFDIQFNFEPLQIGDKVRIEQHSISEGAFDFLFRVRDQVTPGRGTFDAPPAPVKGNIYNTNNLNETVLGYFGVSDVDFKEIIIE